MKHVPYSSVRCVICEQSLLKVSSVLQHTSCSRVCISRNARKYSFVLKCLFSCHENEEIAFSVYCISQTLIQSHLQVTNSAAYLKNRRNCVCASRFCFIGTVYFSVITRLIFCYLMFTKVYKICMCTHLTVLQLFSCILL